MQYDDYDLSVAARVALANEYENQYPIAYENIVFTPPADGSMWLSYHYLPADRQTLSLDLKCQSVIGMVQIDVNFAPGSGMDHARSLAKEICNFFYQGKELSVGYIYRSVAMANHIPGEANHKIPVRFYIRHDGK